MKQFLYHQIRFKQLKILNNSTDMQTVFLGNIYKMSHQKEFIFNWPGCLFFYRTPFSVQKFFNTTWKWLNVLWQFIWGKWISFFLNSCNQLFPVFDLKVSKTESCRMDKILSIGFKSWEFPSQSAHVSLKSFLILLSDALLVRHAAPSWMSILWPVLEKIYLSSIARLL